MRLFNESLGLQPGEQPGQLRLDTREEHQVGPGVIHFAVLAAMAEIAAAASIDAPVVPTTLQLNLLQIARPGRLTANGHVLRRGRRTAVCEGEVRQDETLVAKATVTFALLDSQSMNRETADNDRPKEDKSG